MPRKLKHVEITDDNRDKGKVYLVTEMSAADAADWVMEVGMKLIAAGVVDLGQEIVEQGIPAMMATGFRSFASLNPADARPLLERLFACAKIVPDYKRDPMFGRPPLAEGDIEEWTTRFRLMFAALDLIWGFSEPGAPSISASAPGNLAA